MLITDERGVGTHQVLRLADADGRVCFSEGQQLVKSWSSRQLLQKYPKLHTEQTCFQLL